MDKPRKYTADFRAAAVDLVLVEKRSIRTAADGLGISHNTLAAWVAKARRGHGGYSAPVERDIEARVRQLEEENRRLRIERDILKKATAFFAKEQP